MPSGAESKAGSPPNKVRKPARGILRAMASRQGLRNEKNIFPLRTLWSAAEKSLLHFAQAQQASIH
jgi:hypothetical protein